MSEPRTAGRLARWTATVAGLGNVPFAPGTIGSLAGVLLAWGSHAAFGRWGVPALAVVATAAGIWASDRVARELGRSDPGCVVIDEVAGQAIALAFLPWTPFHAIAGFILFRGFDIIKPPPVRTCERLPGGLGIVADDLAAGALANVALRLLAMWVPTTVGGS